MISIRNLVAVSLAVGGLLFAYGFAALVLGIVPGRGFVVGAFVYVAMAIGAVLVSLAILVAVWFWSKDRSEQLSMEGAAAITVVAPLLAGLAMASVSIQSSFAFWTVIGQAVLSSQFFVGFVTPPRRRTLVLAAEVAVVAGVVAAAYVGTTNWVNVGSLLLLSVGGAVLFLLVGGAFFSLGRRFDEAATPSPAR